MLGVLERGEPSLQHVIPSFHKHWEYLPRVRLCARHWGYKMSKIQSSPGRLGEPEKMSTRPIDSSLQP